MATEMTAQTETLSKRVSLVNKFASRFNVDPEKMMSTLKATAFKVKDGEVTNEQMMALLVVADQYGLNPWTKEIYAFPDKKNGIVPVVGVDGWCRIINENEMFDGVEFRQSETVVTPDAGKPCPEWMESIIYRKDRQHPTIVREYLDEVYQGPRNGFNGPWQTHTKRFLRHKALIQGSRIAFGYVGIYDQDEAERIIEGDAERVQVGKPHVQQPKAKSQPEPQAPKANPEMTPEEREAARKSAAEWLDGDVPQ